MLILLAKWPTSILGCEEDALQALRRVSLSAA